MKNILKVLLIIFALTLLSPSSRGQEAILNQKQLSKAIRKTWKIDSPNISFLDAGLTSESSTQLNGEIYVVKDRLSTVGYAYVGKVFTCRSGGCSAEQKNRDEESFEYFDYIILLNNSISVESIRIFNYQATHGQEICNPSWLKQFKGYNGKTELDYGKEIDAISGATISAISIIIDIQNVAEQVHAVFATTL